MSNIPGADARQSPYASRLEGATVLEGRVMAEKRGYTFGADLCAPFSVYLAIDARKVTVDQLRSDLPRVIAKLENYLATTRAEALR